MRRTILWLLLAAILRVSAAAAGTLVVLYPELPEPERRVFTLMREGVRLEASRQASDVVEIPVQASTSSASLSGRLQAHKPSGVIALGRRAWELSRELHNDVPLVVGAVKLPPYRGDGVRGISAFVDPALTLATLHELAPKIRRVHLVLDSQRDGWIKEPTDAAANRLGLSVVYYEANTLRAAATHYLRILRDISDPGLDALWLLDNRAFVTPDTLPSIIEKSWSRHVVVFSNVFEHVNKGALFALSPEPRAWGRRLAKQVLEPERAVGGGIQFLQDVHRVGNYRIASHLARTVDLDVLSRFDIVVGQR